jgi:hypothetical protein
MAMTTRESTEEWILSKCAATGELADVTFGKTDLPAGADIEDVKRVFGSLKRSGRIVGGGVADSHNGGYMMRLKRVV